jgi:hypothetical protein
MAVTMQPESDQHSGVHRDYEIGDCAHCDQSRNPEEIARRASAEREVTDSKVREILLRPGSPAGSTLPRIRGH